MGNWRKDADPMDMLQAFVAALAGYYDEEFSNKEASYDRAINLIAKVPTIVASWQRIRNELVELEDRMFYTLHDPFPLFFLLHPFFS